MNSSVRAGSLPEFPKTIVTRNGVTIDPWRTTWSYRDTLIKINLDFSSLPVTKALRYLLQLTFIWYAENKSPYYLKNLFHYLQCLLVFSASQTDNHEIDIITGSMLLNYRASLLKRNDYYIGFIAGFLKRMHGQYLRGISGEAICFINNTSFKKNIQGAAVLTMDPMRGPFSEIEFQAINSELHGALRHGTISLAEFLLVWLFLALGQRPVQYAALKVCDFHFSAKKSGETIYSLRIPRAKQRGEVTRASFKDRIIYDEIGRQLALHVQNLKTQCAELNIKHDDFPLFPAKQSVADAPAGYEWHNTSESLAAETCRIADSLNLTSERTDAPLKCNPRRFRYTVGTRAAIEGHGELVIAEILDHSDTQTAAIYVKAVPELIEKFTAKLAFQLAPLANAFKGHIIDPEAESNLPENTYLRIYAPEHTGTMRPTGSCGEHSLCGLMEPLACYTCRSFHPWLNGPHSAVLERLIEERERLLTSASDGNARLASINDLTILAVAEVVSQCEQITQLGHRP